jgi:hypothetical protein
MRVPLNKLMEKLGVDRVLEPYETQPWFLYDEAKGITCSAEVRMGPGAADAEAEIQFLKDEANEEEGESGGTVREQIMRMRALPVTDKEWSPKELFVKGESYVNKLHDWEEKGCNFFRACIESIQMGVLPEIDDLIERELPDDDGMGGGRRGRIGRKSPKIKPGQLMGMNKRGM